MNKDDGDKYKFLLKDKRGRRYWNNHPTRRTYLSTRLAPDLRHPDQRRAGETKRYRNKEVDAYWDNLLADTDENAAIRRSLRVGQFASRMKALCRVLAAWKNEPLLQPGEWCRGYGHHHTVRGSLVDWCNAMKYNLALMNEIATEIPEIKDMLIDEKLFEEEMELDAGSV